MDRNLICAGVWRSVCTLGKPYARSSTLTPNQTFGSSPIHRRLPDTSCCIRAARLVRT